MLTNGDGDGATSFKFTERFQQPEKPRGRWSMRTNTESVFMIFRAIFWIGLVSLLTPHEPDLGLGRPGAGTSQATPSTIASAATGLSRTGVDCGSACAGGLAFLNVIGLGRDTSVAHGLADVKAQIDADIRARAERARSAL